MQPSHAKWEQVLPEQSPDPLLLLTNGHTPTNGHTSSPTNSLQPPPLFKPVPDVVARNRLVTDIVYQSPPVSNLGVPGPDGDINDLGPNGLSAISRDLLDELPEDCRAAFEEALRAEVEWKGRWGTEAKDGSRGKLRIGFNGFPV